METILLACPSCGKRLKAKSSVLGRSVKCPACGNDFVARQVEELRPLPTAAPVAAASPMMECAVCRQPVARAAMEEVDGQLCCPRCCAGRQIGPGDVPAPAAAPAEPAEPSIWTRLKDPRVGTVGTAVMCLISAFIYLYIYAELRGPICNAALYSAQGERTLELASGQSLRIAPPGEALAASVASKAKVADYGFLNTFGAALASVGLLVWALIRERRLLLLPVAAAALAAAMAGVVLWRDRTPMTRTYQLADGDVLTVRVSRNQSGPGLRTEVELLRPDVLAVDRAVERGDVPALVEVLSSPGSREVARQKALEGLWSLGPRAQSALPGLIKLLEQPDPRIVAKVAGVIGGLGPAGREAAPALLATVRRACNAKRDPPAAFKSREESANWQLNYSFAGSLREAAARALADVGGGAEAAAALNEDLVAALLSGWPRDGVEIARTLGFFGPQARCALPALAVLYAVDSDPNKQAETAAQWALRDIASADFPSSKPEAGPVPKLLLDQLGPDHRLRGRAALALWGLSNRGQGNFIPAEKAPVVLELLSAEALKIASDDRNAAALAFRALAYCTLHSEPDPGTYLPLLQKALAHRDSQVQERALEFLPAMGSASAAAIPKLKELASSRDAFVQHAAQEALKKIEVLASEVNRSFEKRWPEIRKALRSMAEAERFSPEKADALEREVKEGLAQQVWNAARITKDRNLDGFNVQYLAGHWKSKYGEPLGRRFSEWLASPDNPHREFLGQSQKAGRE